MAKRKYIDYSLEDLLEDRDFVRIVKNLKTENEWKLFLELHNDSKSKIVSAKEIILLFSVKEKGLSIERKSRVWERVNSFNRSNLLAKQRIRFKYLYRIAASVAILVSLGSLLYLNFKQSEQQYNFSELTSNSNIENPLLVLSNGNKIELKNNVPELTVLKNLNAIQIDNDSIIKSQGIAGSSAQEIVYNEVIVPFGKKSKLELGDGTMVWLNAGSRLAFPIKFSGKKREVFLEGEGYFEVAKNENQPFVVNAGNLDVEVLGTKFNVSAYASDNFIKAILLTGKINVINTNAVLHKKAAMVPNQMAVFNKENNNLELKEEANPEKYIAWINGWYQFSDEELDIVLKKLERYYNVSFEYDQELIAEALPITGKLDLKESFEEVMLVLSRVAKINYEIHDNNKVKIRSIR